MTISVFACKTAADSPVYDPIAPSSKAVPLGQEFPSFLPSNSLPGYDQAPHRDEPCDGFSIELQ